jgi:hypothetical protein
VLSARRFFGCDFVGKCKEMGMFGGRPPLGGHKTKSSIIHVFGSFSFHTHRLVSHVVSGMTNLLMGTELNAQQLEYVKIAQASGNSLVYGSGSCAGPLLMMFWIFPRLRQARWK